MARHLMIDSPQLGRKVHLWQYGTFGMPVIVFPTAAGFAHEWQRQGMLDALSHLVGSKIKLYCPESNVAEAWTRKESDPRWRIQRHLAYERWVVDNLVPFIREDCHLPDVHIGVTGASLGAMYAANMALKFPQLFDYALCLSGRYEVRGFTGGFDNIDVYYNNPLAYVPNLNGEHLQRTRQTHLVLVCGQGKWEEGCIEETIELAGWCRHKGIPHTRDIWGHDVSHDWVWWKRQAAMHLGYRYGR